MGQQNHPILDSEHTGYIQDINDRYSPQSASVAKDIVSAMDEIGKLTYMDIFIEEVKEAIECDSPIDLRKELIQCAAVAVAMIESLDRNGR